MYFVYMIQSLRHEFIYIGSTRNLESRFCEHNSGKNQSTKFYAPFKLVYFEAFADENDAKEREQKLKHHGSVVGHLKKRLKRSLKAA